MNWAIAIKATIVALASNISVFMSLVIINGCQVNSVTKRTAYGSKCNILYNITFPAYDLIQILKRQFVLFQKSILDAFAHCFILQLCIVFVPLSYNTGQQRKRLQLFEKIFEYDTSRLAHSIILYGLNSQLSYEFALELARILNCTGDKSANCACWNCQNINSNQHPSVKTYSNLNNKTTSKESQNVITIEQIHQLCGEIAVSSEYKRVYIICGEEKNSDDNYSCLPLTTDILKGESANALLKSIEEPPKNTYFIFITKEFFYYSPAPNSTIL